MTIQPGDRVSWQHREARWCGGVLLPEQIVTGIVRELRFAEGEGMFAFVVTQPDGRLLMPALDRLTKVEATP